MKYFLNDETQHSSIRQSIDINQAFSLGDNLVKDYALKIKKAAVNSYKNCDKNDKDFDIFNDLEKRAIEIEEEDLKKHKNLMKKIEASVSTIDTISNRDDYQLWNLKRDTLVFPEYLIDHVKAYKFNKIVKQLSNEKGLSVSANHSELSYNYEKNELLKNINKYNKYQLLEEMLSEKDLNS